MPVEITCAACGGKKLLPPSVARGRKFCTAACKYRTYQASGWPVSDGSMKACEICSTQFRVTPSSADSRFCSQKCMRVWRAPVLHEKRYEPHKRVTVRCKWCDIDIVARTARIASGRARFCSKQCHGSWSVANYGNQRTSKAECEFGELLRADGLVFEPQVRLSKWTIDYLFREKKVAVEFDGDYWHSLDYVKVADARKDAYLLSAGYTVVRVPEMLVRSRPLDAVAKVRAAVA